MTLRLRLPAFTVALIFTVGCWSDLAPDSPQDDPIKTRADSDLNDDKQHPTEDDPRVFLTETHDGYFNYPWLTLRDVDALIAEVNQRGLRRLGLKNDHRGRIADSEEPELLRRIVAGCPQLEDLSLSSWTFSRTDVNMLLDGLPHLQTLQMWSCSVTADGSRPPDASVSSLDEPHTGLRKLSVHGGRDIDDTFMAQLLGRAPLIEDLYLSGGLHGESPVSGQGWPFEKLEHLRTLSLGEYTSERLAGTLLEKLPSVESLSLSGDQIRGDCWMTLDSVNLKEFKLWRCPHVAHESLNALFHRLPLLQSLTLRETGGDNEAPLDLSPLAELRELAMVKYHDHDKGALDVCSLNSLKKLESVSIRGVAAEHYSGVDFSLLTNLTTLSLGMRSGSFDIIRDLPPSLESLALARFRTEETVGSHRAPFSQLPRLKTLSISDCEVPPELITTVSNRVETVKLSHCRVSNSTIAEMLQRFVNLEALTLYWSSGGRGYEGDPGAVTGEGWDFAGLEKLRHLDLSKCFYIRDGVIAKISQQLPLLETLKLAEQRHLTGHGWQLERMRNLKTLELDRLTCLSDAVVNHLPVSLESMRIRECDGITGNGWELTRLTNLKKLGIESCDSLESLGQRLPHSLETLSVRGCKKLKCRQLDYASFAGLQSLSFLECFDLDVDRLFAQLPRFARSMRSLNLVGCRPPSTNDWNLAPLNDTLHIFAYEEAEPAYVGGVDEKSYQILRRQLPDCQIFM